MSKSRGNQTLSNNIAQMPLAELRQQWSQCWRMEPHPLIGRTMLERSFEFKLREQKTGGLAPEQQLRLDQLVKTYKRNPRCFDDNQPEIKPGTRLVRMHRGVRHAVLVLAQGYEYKGAKYSSLSQIASQIAGCRRNGWDFFGLKRKEDNP